MAADLPPSAIVDYLAGLDPVKAQELLQAAALQREGGLKDQDVSSVLPLARHDNLLPLYDDQDAVPDTPPVVSETAVVQTGRPPSAGYEDQDVSSVLPLARHDNLLPLYEDQDVVRDTPPVVSETAAALAEDDEDILCYECLDRFVLEDNEAKTDEACEEASLKLIGSLELGAVDVAAAAFGDASLDYVGEAGWTALHWAVHVAITAQNAGDDCGQIGMGDCGCQAPKAHPDMRHLVRAILNTTKAARSINVRTEDGATPLMFAADAGDMEVCRWVLNAGADVSIKDEDGDTALAWAHQKNHHDLVALLSKLSRA
jgi:hypothetical protein